MGDFILGVVYSVLGVMFISLALSLTFYKLRGGIIQIGFLKGISFGMSMSSPMHKFEGEEEEQQVYICNFYLLFVTVSILNQ